MGRSLDELDSRFKPVAESFIAECRNQRVYLAIITTGRTAKEQEDCLRRGVSWTKNSKHLPQPPEGKSWAIDVVPVDLIETKNWSPAHPLWYQIGAIGEKLGLKWGGRWKTTPDWGHFEFQGVSDGQT